MDRSRSASLLDTQRIFGSRDPDEARAFLRAKEFRFDISRRVARQLDLRINGIYLPGVYVGYIQYGAPGEIRTTPARDDYWLQLPIQEEIEFEIARWRIACGPERAAVSSPTHELVIRTKGTGARLNVSVRAATLTRHLAGLLGEEPAAPLELAPVMDLTAGYGRSLAQHVHLAVRDFQRTGWMTWDANAVGTFEEFIVHRLLISHPNNYSDALRRRERALAPRDLRRALDYMHANLAAPITIADIAGVSGISGRTLFQHFRDFRSTSPMRYLREARLAKARDALMRPKANAGVAEVATACGFSHLGRFASDYRNRFGERPSETLRRSRGRGP
ncbi:MAG TPA: AraC family transcriptional regulator [Hyphomicrobiaceae bacterium]|jgi:AraC-like DNA-binding protein